MLKSKRDPFLNYARVSKEGTQNQENHDDAEDIEIDQIGHALAVPVSIAAPATVE